LYREALRAILGAPTDAALGFVNARSRRAAVKLENVDRQQLLRTTTALGVGTLILGPLAALLEGSSEPTPIPKRVGATEIEQIRAAAKVFESWSFTYGGGLARETVFAQLRWSAGFLEATCPARLRPELYYAVGDLADVAGYMAYDADAELASLTMATGDPLQAVTIGDEALYAAGTIRSRRAADGMRELSRNAAPHQQLDEVAHLRHRIATLLVRTDSP
jgi:hypothetical protein